MKNKVLMVLLSLLISFGLWLYVVTAISPESEKTVEDIPVELTGASRLDAKNLIVVSGTENLRMNLTLKGNRSDLRLLNSSNIIITADLSGIKDAGEHRVSCAVSFLSGTADAEVLTQEPEYITVVVAEQDAKTVDVKTTFIGSVPEGYEADRKKVEMDHTSVTVKGPKDIVEQIDHVGITVDMTDQQIAFRQECRPILYGKNGIPILNDKFISMNVDKITATVHVYRAKKVSLVYDYRYAGSGMNADMVTLIPTREVTVLGSDEALSRIESQYTIPVDLSKYTESTTVKMQLPISDELLGSVTCKEDILLEIQINGMDRTKLTLRSDQLKLLNIPSELDIRIPENVQVEIVGAQKDLSSLGEVQIAVDCTDVTVDSGFTHAVCSVQGYEYMKIIINWSGATIEPHAQEG